MIYIQTFFSFSYSCFKFFSEFREKKLYIHIYTYEQKIIETTYKKINSLSTRSKVYHSLIRYKIRKVRELMNKNKMTVKSDY